MWTTELPRLLRNLIGDTEQPFEYADERLHELLIVAAQFVQQEVKFKRVYTVDTDELLLYPDPTDRDIELGRDDDFINLVTLKAACMIETAEARLAAAQNISFRQGSNSVTLGGTGSGTDAKLKLWEKNFCAIYQNAKNSFLHNKIGNPGALVMGPSRAYGYDAYPIDGRYR